MYRTNSNDPSITLILSLETIGLALMMTAGWMGGTLVYRNQVGVDPRYAFSGKWKELHAEQTSGKIEVAAADELLLNQMKLVHVAGKRIVLGKTEQGYKAFDDRCTHKGGSLAGGTMICGTVQCPWHGSQFDVCNGAVKAGPAKEAIGTYTVIEEGSKVYLHLQP
jgi:nitrite reductase/ring-hydroxylating ferredoxin subunit